MVEPEYYNKNGLSPLKAMEQGLISKDEYVGFLKGNVIKYTCRAGHKDDALLDIVKAMDYLMHLHKALKKDEESDLNPDEILTYTDEEVAYVEGRTKIPVNGQKYNSSQLKGNIFTRFYNKLTHNKEEEY